MRNKLPVIMLAVASIFMFGAMQVLYPAADEMVFIRVVEHLPSYSSTAVWWSLDGKTHPSIIVNDPSTAIQYDLTQNMKMWSHPQIPAYLSYPLVRLLNIDSPDATNASITSKVHILRAVAAFMLMLSMAGVLYLLKRHFKNNVRMIALCLAPFIAMEIFFTWQGNNWFYPDTFFTLFLVAALVMRETKYKRYIYVPLALMTGSTIYAVAFLIPFILENKKTAWCALSLLPFFVQSFIASGNPFTPYAHFFVIGTINSSLGALQLTQSFIYNRIMSVVSNVKLAWELLLFAVPPYLYLVLRYVRDRQNMFYILLMSFALIVGLVWWRQFYLMLPIAFLAPLLLMKSLEDIGKLHPHILEAI